MPICPACSKGNLTIAEQAARQQLTWTCDRCGYVRYTRPAHRTRNITNPKDAELPQAIRRACELSIQAGAAFVKTSTGWSPTGATLENISLIKSVAGDAIGIKASGGIRDLNTLRAMADRGATRFGIGIGSAPRILEELSASPSRASRP